jgi:hypothetical protein
VALRLRVEIGSGVQAALLPMRKGLPAATEKRKLDRQCPGLWGSRLLG